MSILLRLASNSFKTQLSFRLDYILYTAFSFLSIVLQICIWQSLYAARNGAVLAGVGLNEMMAYSILSALTSSLVASRIMYEMNDMVQKGEIAQRLLLPIGYMRFMLYSSLSANLIESFYWAVPPCLIGVLFYRMNFNFSWTALITYVLAVILGYGINFCLNFILGLTVFWFKNSFFLQWMYGALVTLFAGAFVPIWFFPSWLSQISRFLPFRYMIFEPVAILLGKYEIHQVATVILFQFIWLVLLWLAGVLVWSKGRKLVLVQGG